MNELPTEVRFVRLGRGRRWERASFQNGEIHGGWGKVPDIALANVDENACRAAIEAWHARRPYKSEAARKGVARRDFDQLMDLIERPDKFVWITIADGRLWWCTAKRGVTINPKGEDREAGHFWLTCDRPWSDRSLKDDPLVVADLPGAVGIIGAFRSTVAAPRYADAILRAIRGEKPPEIASYDRAKGEYAGAVKSLLPLLHWRDFELLTELIFARGGWLRTSTVGRSTETVDIEAEQPETRERALIQVKAAAGQRQLDDYISRWDKWGHNRLFFVVASPQGEFSRSVPPNVHVWTPDKIADLIVRRGLADWVASRVA